MTLLRRPGFAAALAAVHLLVVVLGAARVKVSSPGPLRSLIEIYGAWSGAGNSYGFFAPGVASEWRTTLDYYEPLQGTWVTRTRTAPNLELSLLEATINSSFSHDGIREALAASWAAAQLGEVPDAAAVVVRAEAFLLPTITQYRAGVRGRWRTLAAYAFTTDERMALMDARTSGAASH